VNPKIYVDYIARTEQLTAGIKDIGSSGSKAKAAVQKAFLPALGVLGGLAIAATKAVGAASDLNEQMSRSGAVFGSNAKDVQDWSKGAAEAFGLTRTQALDAASGIGSMLKTAGVSGTDLSGMSKSLVQLAGDMGSFNNIDPSEMLDKLRSGLAGESEPLKRFGVDVSEATVKAYAYSHGIAAAGKPLTEQQKIQARYGAILAQTKDAQGDYARTADGVANSQRTASAEVADLTAKLGTDLLPVTKAVLSVLTSVLGFFGRYPGVLKIVVVAVAALAAAIVVMNVAMTVAAFVTSAWLLPILAVIGAIVALIAIGVLLWKNWDAITAALKAAWAGIQNAAASALAQIKAAFAAALGFIRGLVAGFLSWIRANWQTLLLILAGPIGAAVVLLARYWSQITGAVRGAVGTIKSLWTDLSGFISRQVATIGGYLTTAKDKFAAIGTAAHNAVDAVKSAISDLVHWLERKVSDVASAAGKIASAIKSPINALIGSWNSLAFHIPSVSIPKVDIPGVGKLGGGTFGGQTIPFPDIPRLAAGGVVDSPTLALIGEGHGREVVAPEDLLRELIAEGGGGDSFTLNIYVRDADPATIAYGFRRLELLRTGR